MKENQAKIAEMDQDKRLTQLFVTFAQKKTGEWLTSFLGGRYLVVQDVLPNVFMPDSDIRGFAKVILTATEIEPQNGLQYRACTSLSEKGWMVCLLSPDGTIFSAQPAETQSRVLQAAARWFRLEFGRQIEIRGIWNPAKCEDGSVAWDVRYVYPKGPPGLTQSLYVFLCEGRPARVNELLNCFDAQEILPGEPTMTDEQMVEKLEAVRTALTSARDALKEVKDGTGLDGVPFPLVSLSDSPRPLDLHGGLLATELALSVLNLESAITRTRLMELLYSGGVLSANFTDEEAAEIHRRLTTPTQNLF